MFHNVEMEILKREEKNVNAGSNAEAPKSG